MTANAILGGFLSFCSAVEIMRIIYIKRDTKGNKIRDKNLFLNPC